MHETEVLKETKTGFMSRTTVPGGWIYTTVVANNSGQIFVPEPAKEIKVDDSVIEEVKEYLHYISDKDNPKPDEYELFWKAKGLLQKLENIL